MNYYKLVTILTIALVSSINSWAQTIAVNTQTPTEKSNYAVPKPKDLGETKTIGPSPSSPSKQIVKTPLKPVANEASVVEAQATSVGQKDSATSDVSSADTTQILKKDAENLSTTALSTAATSSSGSTNQVPTLNKLAVSVQPFTGSASIPITINVPSGRAGIQPSVALVYSSGLPESFVGVGWNLDMGSIQRSTKKGPPKYNSTDTFVLMQNGSSGNLVWDASASMYRSEIEGAFAKITSSGSGASQTWLMTDKKGTKYYFGQTAASRQSDPADSAKIFEWALDRVEDISGNFMTIVYLKHGNKLYPDTIQYTGNSNAPVIAPFAKVVFNYSDVTRALTSYKTSFLVSSSKLLDNVSVYANNNLLTKYKLNYQQSVNSKRYLLTSVVQYGADGVSVLPAVTFTYQGDVKGFNLETDWSVPIDGQFTYQDTSTNRRVDRGVRIADMNGDAYPDLVRAYNSCGDVLSAATYLNNKSRGFALSSSYTYPSTMKGFIRSCSSADYSLGTQLVDINGDLWTDAIRNYKTDPTLGGTLIIQSKLSDKLGGFVDSSPWLSPTDTAITWQKGLSQGAEYSEFQGVLYSDVNGDGFTDIIISKFDAVTNHKVYINQAANGGTGWLLDPVWTPPVSTYSDFTKGATLTDINGDGLADLVYLDGNAKIYINNGHGWIDAPSVWDWPPDLTARLTTGNAQFADVNGDGLPDIVKGDGNYIEVTINTGAGWYDDRSSWLAPSGYFAKLDQRLLDANADGVLDYMYALYGFTTEMYMNKSKPADLLVKVTNGIGATTEITYESSAKYTNTFLPFIVQVVKSVKVSIATESYTTNYSYANGLWAGDTREFRGFGQVRVTDPDANYTVTNYLQDKIYKGMVSSQETYDSTNLLFAKTVNTWDKKTLIAGDVSVFPFLKRVDNYLYDGASADRRTAQEFFYDETTQYGNMTKSIEYGEVVLATGTDTGTDKRTTETTYVNNATLWLLGLPKQVTIKDNAGTQVRLTSFYYDNNVNLTDAPIKGRLTKRVRWNGTGNPTPTDLYSYDATGNLLTTTDPLNNVTSISYDPLKVFPLTTTNALSHVVTTEYYGVNGVALNDGAGLVGLWGQVKSVKDANNQKAYRVYDTFGRMTRSISPLDSVGFPTTIVDYTFTSQYSSVMTRQRRNPGVAGVIDTVQFFDGLGRLIQTKTETVNASQFIVAGQTQYNSRGLPLYKYVPRFTSNNLTVIDPIVTTEPKVTLTYDAMGRQIRTTNPDGTYANTVYDGWHTYQYDERGARTDYAYDAYGRIWRVREYSGYDGRSPTLYPTSSHFVYAATHYTYDSEGNLKSVNNNGNDTYINYDFLGHKTSMADPDMGSWSYTYDLNGNLKTQTDAKGQVITFTYDALNRLKTKVSGTALNVVYTYDDTVNSGYAKGRLSNVTYTGGSTKFVYDVLGRETQSVKTIDGTAYTVSRVYDNLNNVTKIVYPDLSEVHYQYNSVGQLQAIANNASVLPPLVSNQTPNSPLQTMLAKLGQKGAELYASLIEPNFLGVKTAEAAVPNTLFVSGVTYNAMGQATTINYGNGTITTQTFNSPMFRLNRIRTVNAAAVVLQDLNYTYDAIGNIRTITDNVNSADQTFSYDHRNRLTQAVGQVYGTQNYSYDVMGNIITKEGVTYTYSKVNAGPHAVTSLSDGTTMTYDLNGNLSTMVKPADSKAFIYDVENRLIDVKKNGSTVAQYFYDGDGGRTAKISYTTGQAGNNTCFLAGTKVLMDDGRWVNIENIKVGDRVVSYDEKKMANTSAKVTEMFDGESAKEYLLVNGTLKVTPNHKFYSKGKWIEIGKLEIGDLMFDDSGAEVAIKSIEKITTQNSVRVYNIEVEGDHNYFVATSQERGVLVHNKLSYNPPAVAGVSVTSGVITRYVGSLSEETKGAWVNHVFMGSTKMATVTSSEVRYSFQDHLGSANVATNSSGTSIELIEYKPFGDFSRREQYGTSNAAWYYFTGKPLDDESGLMYYGARYYSPLLGRFITPDTLIPSPGNPQALNRYSYVYNNPVRLTDPTGNFPWLAFAIGAFIGGGASAIQSYQATGSINWKSVAIGALVGGLSGATLSNATTAASLQISAFPKTSMFLLKTSAAMSLGSQVAGAAGLSDLSRALGMGSQYLGYAFVGLHVATGIANWVHDPRFQTVRLDGGSGGIQSGDKVHINGMVTPLDKTQGFSVNALSEAKSVGANVLAYNPTSSPIADLVESIFSKMFFTGSVERQVSGGLTGLSGITLSGFSQGGIIASNTMIGLALTDQRSVVSQLVVNSSQISQIRMAISGAMGGGLSFNNGLKLGVGSRLDFSNALGPNLRPDYFLGGLIGLSILPIGLANHYIPE